MLYKCKEVILKDVLLIQASKMIEAEFFNKVVEYPKEDENIVIVLETFYQLHHAGYYSISDVHYKQLFEELAIRKPESYGRKSRKISNSEMDKFPTDTVTKFQPASDPLPNKWIEIYNRLFELINVDGDARNLFFWPSFY